MARSRNLPAICVHGGAGAAGPGSERVRRRRGILSATREGANILQAGGSALDAVIATVVALEDDVFFNAGYGSLLNSEGNVEMDASVMLAEPIDAEPAPSADSMRGKRLHRHSHREETEYSVSAGAVAAVSRVRNPVTLARAVMEQSPHILMVAAGAERFARTVGIQLVRPAEMISERARNRWQLRQQALAESKAESAARAAIGRGREVGHGTVGAVAIDLNGAMASATSTGGVPGKLFGRVGDSALIGAGTFAHAFGAASATGQGEAIILSALCREAVLALAGGAPNTVARAAIAELIARTGAEAGIILIDRRGRIGYAHNAASMQVARFDPQGGLRHLWLEPIGKAHGL
jgi:L-asparaginase / beta-aspartyl-peptidase